jgi:hypothetical protein
VVQALIDRVAFVFDFILGSLLGTKWGQRIVLSARR